MTLTKKQRAVLLYKEKQKPIVYYITGNYKIPSKMYIYEGNNQIKEFILVDPRLFDGRIYSKKIRKIMDNVEEQRRALRKYLEQIDYIPLDQNTVEKLNEIFEEALYDEIEKLF